MRKTRKNYWVIRLLIDTSYDGCMLIIEERLQTEIKIKAQEEKKNASIKFPRR